jgi:hypothetical protein
MSAVHLAVKGGKRSMADTYVARARLVTSVDVELGSTVGVSRMRAQLLHVRKPAVGSDTTSFRRRAHGSAAIYAKVEVTYVRLVYLRAGDDNKVLFLTFLV